MFPEKMEMDCADHLAEVDQIIQKSLILMFFILIRAQFKKILAKKLSSKNASVDPSFREMGLGHARGGRPGTPETREGRVVLLEAREGITLAWGVYPSVPSVCVC